MLIAKTILEQLGGSKFIAMTGAKSFITDGNGLQFKLPSRFARGGTNFVRITLEPSDLYKMEFFLYRKNRDLEMVDVMTGVYCDQLQTIFTGATGLDVSL
jgi:hypothetical protein